VQVLAVVCCARLAASCDGLCCAQGELRVLVCSCDNRSSCMAVLLAGSIPRCGIALNEKAPGSSETFISI